MPPVVKYDEPRHLEDVLLLGPDAVVFGAQALSDAVEESRALWATDAFVDLLKKSRDANRKPIQGLGAKPKKSCGTNTVCSSSFLGK